MMTPNLRQIYTPRPGVRNILLTTSPPGKEAEKITLSTAAALGDMTISRLSIGEKKMSGTKDVPLLFSHPPFSQYLVIS